MDITDTLIFNAVRKELKPITLTQTVVDIANIAMESEAGRNKIIERFDVVAPKKEVMKRDYNLTKETLLKAYPGANTSVIPLILENAPKYGIITKKQMCAFLGNCLVESRGFTAKRESFAYKPNRLIAVFGTKRVPSLDFAKKLIARGEVAIANHLYGERYGNRPGTNDGWDYRGGGWIQNTFRSNYYELQNITGIPFGDNPRLIEDMENACVGAMVYWNINNCNALAELINVYKDGYTLNTLNAKGVETKKVEMNTGMRLVRKAVNGGFNGIDEVGHAFERCMRYM